MYYELHAFCESFVNYPFFFWKLTYFKINFILFYIEFEHFAVFETSLPYFYLMYLTFFTYLRPSFHLLVHCPNTHNRLGWARPCQSWEIGTQTRSPKCLIHHLLPLGTNIADRTLESRVELDIEPRFSDTRCWNPRWCLNHDARCLSFFFFFF